MKALPLVHGSVLRRVEENWGLAFFVGWLVGDRVWLMVSGPIWSRVRRLR